jgi:hypothetical protein
MFGVWLAPRIGGGAGLEYAFSLIHSVAVAPLYLMSGGIWFLFCVFDLEVRGSTGGG